MSHDNAITHITPVGGNIFADLGFEPEEAARLLAESDAAITAKLKAASVESHLVEVPLPVEPPSKTTKLL